MKNQFTSRDTQNEEEAYDYKSIMHYPAWIFSKDPFAKITMSTMDPSLQHLIDDDHDLPSFRDIKLINKIYGCSKKCKSSNNTQCLNDGYILPMDTEENCSCLCPPNFGGDFCEQHIESNQAICDGTVFNEGIIESPGYPKRLESCISYSWRFKVNITLSKSVHFFYRILLNYINA